nr:hypothetical protein [Candidatus Freyarchaeota archaeon]
MSTNPPREKLEEHPPQPAGSESSAQTKKCKRVDLMAILDPRLTEGEIIAVVEQLFGRSLSEIFH